MSHSTFCRIAGRIPVLAIVSEITGGQRARKYRYSSYLRLFDEPVTTIATPPAAAPAEDIE